MAKKAVDEQACALIVQNHQLNGAETQLGRLDSALVTVAIAQRSNQEVLNILLAEAEARVKESDVIFEIAEDDAFLIESSIYVSSEEAQIVHRQISLLDHIDINEEANWAQYLDRVESYANRHDIAFGQDPFRDILSVSQRVALEKRIAEEFSLKGARCDKYDYMIAGTCGLIGGLIDVFFVGLPGQGILTEFTDDVADGIVRKFAQLNGWNKENAENKGSDLTASAIGFLENKFHINYDQATTYGQNGTGGIVSNMSMKNHHIKSLGHSPDLVGLFFSVLDQFTSTAHFVSDGNLVSINTETFELRGTNVASKIFSGFCNWLGHLFSDMAGSSGTRNKMSGRGAGIPIPFYSLLQFVDVGEFGQHKQTFATVSVKVFEQGYDLRHGMAMAIPVLVSELLTRTMWMVKQRFYHKNPWVDCIPCAGSPELRRMLLISHGSLCLIDTTDAALRSGGDIVQFMLRSNLIAWARFGTLALKELRSWYREGSLDIEVVDAYLDAECKRLLAA